MLGSNILIEPIFVHNLTNITTLFPEDKFMISIMGIILMTEENDIIIFFAKKINYQFF